MGVQKISSPRRELAVFKAGEFRCPNCNRLLCCGGEGTRVQGVRIRCGRCHSEIWIEYGVKND